MPLLKEIHVIEKNASSEIERKARKKHKIKNGFPISNSPLRKIAVLVEYEITEEGI
jgi:hypothetical protein